MAKKKDVEEVRARVQQADERPKHDVDLDALAMTIARAHTEARAMSIIDQQYAGKLQSCVMIAPRRHEIEAIRLELEMAFGPSNVGSSIALAR